MRSHQRAVAAHERRPLRRGDRAGRRCRSRKGSTSWSTRDEHPRADTTLESAGASCDRSWAGIDPEATVTAGNASGQNDGAARVHRHHRARAPSSSGLRPLARLVSWAVGRRRARASWASARCRRPRKALERAGLTLARHGPDRAQRGLRRPGAGRARASGSSAADDFERINVNGSGISLGHPVGATGGRILATLLREMQRRERPLRAGDHVHRRRPGPRGGVRAHRRVSRTPAPVTGTTGNDADADIRNKDA